MCCLMRLGESRSCGRRSCWMPPRGYGYELVMPPLLEHLESLLSGTGRALDLRTFKLVDQLSGRTLGVRADTTPQVARIDAHLLNRAGLTRLCYCGPVLHTLPAGPDSTREPLQFGAEIYGHGGLEADLEVHELALECLGRARVESLVMDLADARFVQGALEGVTLSPAEGDALRAVLAAKDQAELQALTADLPAMNRDALRLLPSLFGGDEVLEMARARLPNNPLIAAALNDVQWLATHLRRDYPSLRLGFRSGRSVGLRLLQRYPVRDLQRRWHRCAGARWTLRQCRRHLRTPACGGGLQPRSEVRGGTCPFRRTPRGHSRALERRHGAPRSRAPPARDGRGGGLCVARA